MAPKAKKELPQIKDKLPPQLAAQLEKRLDGAITAANSAKITAEEADKARQRAANATTSSARIQAELEAQALEKKAKRYVQVAGRLESGAWQGAGAGMGIGAATGMGIGTVIGTVVGGVAAIPTTLLGGLIGAGTGAIHGPWVKITDSVMSQGSAKGGSEKYEKEEVTDVEVDRLLGELEGGNNEHRGAPVQGRNDEVDEKKKTSEKNQHRAQTRAATAQVAMAVVEKAHERNAKKTNLTQPLVDDADISVKNNDEKQTQEESDIQEREARQRRKLKNKQKKEEAAASASAAAEQNVDRMEPAVESKTRKRPRKIEIRRKQEVQSEGPKDKQAPLGETQDTKTRISKKEKVQKRKQAASTVKDNLAKGEAMDQGEG